MMSYNRRSTPVINDHLPIEEGREYSFNRKKREKMATIILQVTLQLISSSG
jgi:hypothetical protein